MKTGVHFPRVLSASACTIGILVVGGCITIGTEVAGSGPIVRETRSVAPFSHIVIDGSANVDVTVGTPASLVVEAQKNIAEVIATTVSRDTLTIKDRKSYSSDRPVRLTIVTPRLEGVRLNGSSNVHVAGARGDNLTLSINGAGNIHADGKVKALTLDSSGVGNAELSRLEAGATTVTLSGVGNAHIGPAGTLSVGIYGVGSVTYLGSPRILRREIRGIGSLSPA